MSAKDEAKRSGRSSFFESLGSSSIPSLFTLCGEVLRQYIDDLPPLQHLPKEIYESILSKCTIEKLQEIEKYNKEHGVILDTSNLWMEHFKNKFSRNVDAFRDQLDESKKNPWKALYLKKLSQDAQKLDKLSQKLEQYKKEQQKKTEKSQIKVIDVRAANVRKSDQGVKGVLKKAVASVDPIAARANSSRGSNKAEQQSSSGGGGSKLWKMAKLGGSQKPTSSQVLRPEKIASSAPTRKEPQHMTTNTPSYLPPGIQTRKIIRNVTTIGRPKIDFTKNRPSSPTQPDWTPTDKVGRIDAESIFGKSAGKGNKLNELRKKHNENMNARKRPMGGSDAQEPVQKKQKVNHAPMTRDDFGVGGMPMMKIPKKKKDN